MSSPAFAPDAKAVAFLKTVKTVSTLVLADTATGKLRQLTSPAEQGDTDTNLTLEEKLRRERTRQTTQGVNSFVWLPDSTSVVFPRGGNLMRLDTAEGASGSPTLLLDKTTTGATGAALDPKPSPDGSKLAFVQQDEVYIMDITGGAPGPAVRVTYGAREAGAGVHHGVPDFIVSEEFDRQTGYWWSPDGKFLAFQETDERHVKQFRIQHIDSTDPYGGEDHAYPFSGTANAKVRMGVINVEAALTSKGAAAPVVWMDTGADEDIYIVRGEWMPVGMGPCSSGAPSFVLQVLNRGQDVLDVVAYDAGTGRGTLLLREVSSPSIGAWVNVLGQLAFLAPSVWPPTSLPAHAASHAAQLGGFMLWGSERTGYAQVYAYGMPKDAAAYAQVAAYTGPPKTSAAQTAPLHSTFARFTSPATIAEEGGLGGMGLGLGLGGGSGGGDSELSRILGAADVSRVGVATCLGCITGRSTSHYMVESLLGVAGIPGSPSAGPALYFTGTLDSPLERHAYCVPVFRPDAEAEVEERASPYGMPGIRRLTSGAGMHTVVMSPHSGPQPAAAQGAQAQPVLLVDTCSTLHCPPSLVLLRFDPTQRFSASPVARSSLGGRPSSLGSGSSGVPTSTPTPTQGRSLGGSIGTSWGGSLGSTGHGSLGSSAGPMSPLSRALLHGNAADALLAPFTGETSLVDIAANAVSFDTTGAYGGRISSGVALVAVLSGALPVGLHGTPSVYPKLLDVVQTASSRRAADASSQSSFNEDASGPITVPSMTGLFNTVAAKLDNLGEALASQLKEASDDLGSKLTQAMGRGVAPFVGGGAGASANEGGKGATDSAGAAAALTPEQDVWMAADPADAKAAADAARNNPPPLFFRLPAADSSTPLFGALFIPDADKYGPGPWPCILSVYGGPHVQRVKADWACASEMRAQSLRRDGFLVLVIDNRGSSRRGLAFEAELHRRMGTVEVQDQAHAVQAVKAAGLADPSRIGVYGWSYGGYMTLMCLAKYPGIFHAGVSGAPVTFWQGYDTGYTERYMGTPANNEGGYSEGSVLNHVSKIQGRLLLVHGLLDENVHARHSWALVAALHSAGVPHETMFIPGERHVVRDPAAKAYLEQRFKDHFRRYISPDVAAPGGVTRIVLPNAGAAAQAAADTPAASPVLTQGVSGGNPQAVAASGPA